MAGEQSSSLQGRLQNFVVSLADIPWLGSVIRLWVMVEKLVQRMSSEGMYEVLDYSSTLEVLDRQGKTATFQKQKKVRYLQDNIIAFQDYAWGDGKILLDYKTSRGVPVDKYRSGFKTYILLSLREIKNRGDIDEFNIQWNLSQGFLTKDGYWSTDVSSRTRHLLVNVILPRNRPPTQITLEETNRQRTRNLSADLVKKLPDGRWQISWETNKPKLHEIYVIRWLW